MNERRTYRPGAPRHPVAPAPAAAGGRRESTRQPVRVLAGGTRRARRDDAPSTRSRGIRAGGANLRVEIGYRGGVGDRLADATHAALVDLVVGVLASLGWLVELEYGFNVFGERGSVDILAWHPPTRTLLIVEIKSRFTDLQAMLLSLARKLRLVPGVVREERGWDATAVARIVVTYGTTENRSIMSKHEAMFATALPARSVEIRRWLRSPDGPIAGVWLVSRDAVEQRVAGR